MAVSDGVDVIVLLGEGVRVGEGVSEDVAVGVQVEVTVLDGVGVKVKVLLGVGVRVGREVFVAVDEGVDEAVGVSVGASVPELFATKGRYIENSKRDAKALQGYSKTNNKDVRETRITKNERFFLVIIVYLLKINS